MSSSSWAQSLNTSLRSAMVTSTQIGAIGPGQHSKHLKNGVVGTFFFVIRKILLQICEVLAGCISEKALHSFIDSRVV